MRSSHPKIRLGQTPLLDKKSGPSHFIIQDDKKIIDKILIRIEQMNKTDQKITLCKIKFNLGACKELSKKEIDSLSNTARDFLISEWLKREYNN